MKEGLIVVKGLTDQEATKIAREELAKVGLSDRETTILVTSGGQKQCGFARALAIKPEVFCWMNRILGLGSRIGWRSWKLNKPMAKSGQTMVLVSHDMSL